MEFDNIELRMFVCENNEGFHTKGYFFSHPEEVCLIVGSSNLTDKALCLNQEFNLQVYSTYEGSLARSCLQEFDSLFHAMNSVDYRLYQETYEEQYRLSVRLKEKEEELLDLRKPTVLSPNTMQLQFIQRLKELISKGQSRALLVSATGTGKTYAAAFAVREFAPKRILFLVHREQIARKSMESFRRVIGTEEPMACFPAPRRITEKTICSPRCRPCPENTFIPSLLPIILTGLSSMKCTGQPQIPTSGSLIISNRNSGMACRQHPSVPMAKASMNSSIITLPVRSL